MSAGIVAYAILYAAEAVGLALACAAVAVLAAQVLTAAAAGLGLLRSGSGRSRATGATEQASALRVAVVVPAHDEASGIAPTLRDLAGQRYPAGAFRVVVVADNCTDGTAGVARAEVACIQGAEVWERADAERRGKGWALRWAVIDADTRVDAGFLEVASAAVARGVPVVQGRYRVRNPESSWRTRLLAVALGLAHHVRAQARTAWGCGVSLKGNGMMFDTLVLRRLPWDATSMVEDAEYSCRLAEAGVYARYEPAAVVAGEMAVAGPAAAVQRRRWEEGRRGVARVWAGRLLAAAWRTRDWRRAEAAVDIAFPPLALLAGGVAAGLGLDLALGGGLAAVWAGCAGTLAVVVASAPLLSGEGRLRDLAGAPFYVAWKAVLCLKGMIAPERAWVRTPRLAAAQGSVEVLS